MKRLFFFFILILLLISCKSKPSNQVQIIQIKSLNFIDSTNYDNGKKLIKYFDFYLIKNFSSKEKDSAFIFDFVKKINRQQNLYLYSIIIVKESSITNEKTLFNSRQLSNEQENDALYEIQFYQNRVTIASFINEKKTNYNIRDSL
jgi:hypothetical protein